jgi:hypothetical protein
MFKEPYMHIWKFDNEAHCVVQLMYKGKKKEKDLIHSMEVLGRNYQ